MKRPLARLAWYAAIAVLAVTAVGLQMDRQAVMRYRLAQSVPGPFRSDALAPIVITALEDGRSADAVNEARTLIFRAPVDADGLSLLATAAHATGDRALAVRAIQLAATRGWRSEPAQIAMIGFALSANQPDTAAARLSALWAIGTVDEQVTLVTRLALERPEVRRAFVRQNADAPTRTDAVVAWAGSNLEPEVFAGLLDDIRRQGEKPDCTVMGQAVGKLLSAGNGAFSRRLWAASACGQMDDYAFIRRDAVPAGPFDWTYPHGPSIDRDFAAGRLQFDNHDPVQAVLAVRQIALAPGAHTVDARVTGAMPTVSVVCRGGAYRALGGELGQTLAFTVPQDCGSQTMTITVSQGDGTIADFRVR
jgi:hypothetical protein